MSLSPKQNVAVLQKKQLQYGTQAIIILTIATPNKRLLILGDLHMHEKSMSRTDTSKCLPYWFLVGIREHNPYIIPIFPYSLLRTSKLLPALVQGFKV